MIFVIDNFFPDIIYTTQRDVQKKAVFGSFDTCDQADN